MDISKLINSVVCFFFHREGHCPLPARRGAARLDGDGGRVAAGAAEAELEVKLTVPSCSHRQSKVRTPEEYASRLHFIYDQGKEKQHQENDSRCTWSSSSYVWASKLVTASLP